MQSELILEREFIRNEIRMLIISFMKETDKEVASEIVLAIKKRSKRIEEINCKLALIEFQEKFQRKDSV